MKSANFFFVLWFISVHSGKSESRLGNFHNNNSYNNAVNFVQSFLVICQYQWNCTAPNENGQQYLPSVRERDATSTSTFSDILYIYCIPNLDGDCYGPVTAIEYCYWYSSFAIFLKNTFSKQGG